MNFPFRRPPDLADLVDGSVKSVGFFFRQLRASLAHQPVPMTDQEHDMLVHADRIRTASVFVPSDTGPATIQLTMDSRYAGTLNSVVDDLDDQAPQGGRYRLSPDSTSRLAELHAGNPDAGIDELMDKNGDAATVTRFESAIRELGDGPEPSGSGPDGPPTPDQPGGPTPNTATLPSSTGGALAEPITDAAPQQPESRADNPADPPPPAPRQVEDRDGGVVEPGPTESAPTTKPVVRPSAPETPLKRPPDKAPNPSPDLPGKTTPPAASSDVPLKQRRGRDAAGKAAVLGQPVPQDQEPEVEPDGVAPGMHGVEATPDDTAPHPSSEVIRPDKPEKPAGPTYLS